MQIHDLNTGTPASGHYIAMDSGTDTYKATPGNIVPSYTSGDASSASSWTSVTAVSTGLSFSTLINRITTMMKNVRYLYSVIGSNTFSTVASTVTGAIGNTALGTTATTISGAIAEHEGDISTINSAVTESTGTFTKISTVTLNAATKLHKTGNVVTFAVDASTSAQIGTGSGGAGFIEFPAGYRPATAVLFLGMDATNTVVKGFYVPANGKAQVLISNIPSGATFRVAGSFSIT